MIRAPRLERSRNWVIVEKKDHLAVHGIFMSRESAEKHLKEVVPIYVDKGYYMDKTLTKDCFEVIEKQITKKL